MDLSKIYENTYKNTMPNTNTLIRLSETEKSDFAKTLENKTKELDKKRQFNLTNDIEIKKSNINEKLLKEQTDAFEAFMIKNVLDISLKIENPLFGKDAADDIYGSMYNDAMSKALSGGLGFSEILFNFLKERV